jgi:5-methylcytosine-specific restriction endonuclease McrA
VLLQAVAAVSEPYPKSRQLARGERRYRRKVASAKQWQRIVAAKIAPCRVCRDPATNGSVHSAIQFHHLVPRDLGGDDTADNIVPLCSDCHGLATLRNPLVLEVLARHLTDGEYAYIVGKMGETGMERLFGVGR